MSMLDPDDDVIVDLPDIVIRSIVVSPYWGNNVYLLTSKSTGAQMLIDAADQADKILELLEESHADSPHCAALAALVTTHQHADHIQALHDIVGRTGVPTYAGEFDAAAITEQTGVAIDHRVADGDTISVPGIDLLAIWVRGHTPGSIILALAQADGPTHLFVGDDLFPGGIGKVSTRSEFTQLMDDIDAKIMARFPDDTVVWPGHGLPTTLGAERPNLAAWRARGW